MLVGRGDRAVLELREQAPGSGWGTNLVITVAEHRIVAMEERRRAQKAQRLAGVA